MTTKERIFNTLKQIYTVNVGIYRTTPIEAKFDTDEINELLHVSLVVRINKVSYRDGKDGYTAVEGDWDVIESSEQTVVLTFKLEREQLVNINNSTKVQINAARYVDTLKFYSTSFRVDSLFVNFKSGTCSILNQVIIPIGNLMDYYRVYNEFLDGYGVPAERYPIKPGVDTSVLDNLTFSDRATKKLEIISKGRIKFEDHKMTGKILIELLKILAEGQKEWYDGFGRKLQGFDVYNQHIPSDYEFVDAVGGICYELKSKWKSIRRDIIYNLANKGKLVNSSLQSIINKYYRQQADVFRNVQATKNSNALTQLSQGNMIYFHERIKGTKNFQKERIYNEYFAGVLDPVRTRDGGNTSISNELSLACRIDGDKIFIKCYNLAAKAYEEIEYTDYITTKLFNSDMFDWNKMELKVRDEYTYTQYGAFFKVHSNDNSFSSINYVRTLDALLSTTTSCMPFVNRMVGTRSLLGSHFLDQSIPAKGSKPCPVSTTYTNEYYKTCPYNTASDVDGVVVDVDGSKVKIKYTDADGKECYKIVGYQNEIERTSMGTTNIIRPTVKVGEEVKKGQIVSAINSFKDGEFTTQVPLYVMYGTYEGREHEDGIILTESAAKKFSHVIYQPVVSTLSSKAVYEFKKGTPDDRYDEWGMIKVGQKVSVGDVLGTYWIHDYKNKLANSLANLQGQVGYVTKKYTIKCPLDIQVGGVVKEVKVIYNQAYYAAANDITKEFINYYDRLDTQRINEKNAKGFKESKQYIFDTNIGINIQFTIEYENTMYTTEKDGNKYGRLAGKLSNFYASKGVNVYLIPDKYAPKDEFGNTIECVIQSYTTYSRNNPGQIDEVKLGLLLLEAGKYYEKNGCDETLSKVLDILYPNGWEEEKLRKDYEAYGYFRVKLSPFDDYYHYDNITKALEILGLGNGDSRIYLPEYDQWTKGKSTVGITAMMRLHFIQEHKAKVTPDLRVDTDNDCLVYTDSMKGDGGQKFSAQEVWALQGNAQSNVLKAIAQDNDSKYEKLHSALLMLGLDLTSSN